jgi:hypothetical protein
MTTASRTMNGGVVDVGRQSGGRMRAGGRRSHGDRSVSAGGPRADHMGGGQGHGRGNNNDRRGNPTIVVIFLLHPVACHLCHATRTPLLIAMGVAMPPTTAGGVDQTMRTGWRGQGGDGMPARRGSGSAPEVNLPPPPVATQILTCTATMAGRENIRISLIQC